MIRLERHTDPAAARFAPVAEIVIDRPDKRNALTPAMIERITGHARALADDPTARALLLRGEGPVFCAGFDLSLCRENSDALAQMLRALSEAVLALRALPKPVVIAAHGAAVAGGCALLGGADIVITDTNARLGYPVVSLGISPAVSAPFLRLATGDRAARQRLLDPCLITGQEAARIGLADRCVDLPEDVVPRAQIEALKLAEKPPHALAATKAWLNRIEDPAIAGHAAEALAASLALVGSREERDRLEAMWAARA